MSRTLSPPQRAVADELAAGAAVAVTLVRSPALSRDRRFSWQPDSNAVAKFWTPIVGPSCLAVGRAAVYYEGHVVVARDLARAVGLNVPLFVRSCDRLNRYGLGGLRRDGAARFTLAVDTPWPYLSRYQVGQLPDPVRAVYLRLVLS